MQTSKFMNLVLIVGLCLTILFGLAVIHTDWLDTKQPHESQIQLISGLVPDFYIDEHESQYLAQR